MALLVQRIYTHVKFMGLKVYSVCKIRRLTFDYRMCWVYAIDDENIVHNTTTDSKATFTITSYLTYEELTF